MPVTAGGALKLRRAAYERQGGLCFWCQCPMIVKTKANASWVWNHPRMCTGDHVKRKADGGVLSRENIVAACAQCNSNRHWSPPEIPHASTGATLADVWPITTPPVDPDTRE